MKTALIGLGMVAGTYGDAIRNAADLSLARVYAALTRATPFWPTGPTLARRRPAASSPSPMIPGLIS